jgi:hypothetical protein
MVIEVRGGLVDFDGDDLTRPESPQFTGRLSLAGQGLP